MRYYGKWMRDEAEKRIGHLYPKVKAIQESDGSFRHATDEEIQNPKSKIQNLTVIAWLWARTVKCPNPTCGAMMPLVRSFALSTKKGKEAWVSPVIDGENKTIRFEIQTSKSKVQNQAGTVDRRGARCLVCSTVAPLDHVRAEGKAGRMVAQMMAIVAEGDRKRIYLAPNAENETIAKQAAPENVPDTDLPKQALGFRVQTYGMTKHRDLFTNRQLVALTSFSDLVGEAREEVLKDAQKAKIESAEIYANAIATYSTFVVDRGADKWATPALWNNIGEKVEHVFGRQTLSMTWDFAEGNSFSNSTGHWGSAVELVAKVVNDLPSKANGSVNQNDAASKMIVGKTIISTDPPYYDAIGYADLSDFFYIWAKRSLNNYYDGLLNTLLVPKTQEVVAEPFRHGGRQNAQKFFEEKLGDSFGLMRKAQHTDFPLTVFYAFKQTESENDNGSETQTVTASTGWETMLEGLINAGFQITGTIPMRTERAGRLRDTGSNALASSIVLVCRPRPEDTDTNYR